MSRWFKTPRSVFGRAKDASISAMNRVASVPASTVADERYSMSSPEALSRYYVAKAREKFHDGRYKTIRQLGVGGYSHVWLAKDLKYVYDYLQVTRFERNLPTVPRQDSFVALKLLTSDCYGTDHDIFELEILEKISQQQTQLYKGSNSHVIGLLDSFRVVGPSGTHQCIVMPVLGSNINVQAHRFSEGRIPARIMKAVIKQLLLALSFLHNNCGIIHTGMLTISSVANVFLGSLTD